MTRTTTIGFKAQIKVHILVCLSEDYTTLTEKFGAAAQDFNNWYNNPSQQRKTPNKQDAFQEFLMCLPSTLSVEYTHYGISQTLKKWHESADMEYKERSSDKELQFYCALIYREFNAMCRKLNINF